MKELLQFIKSSSFSRAILMGIAVTVPIIIGISSGHFEIGLAICFGAFWSSPSNVSGSFRQKRIGILISAAMVTIVSFIGAHLHYETWISLPVLGVLSFCISYISIYGFRASLISLSGLFAMVISLGNELEVLEIYQYAIFVGIGGIWYFILTKIWYHINPKAETEELLTKTYELTAEFLKIRGKLIGSQVDYDELQTKLLKLQSDLTENHGVLREILLQTRKSRSWSIYQDKRLLVFVQLIEMMETAIANPVNYNRMDELFIRHPHFLTLFQKLIFEMSNQLFQISQSGNNSKKLPKNEKLSVCFKNLKKEISTLQESMGYEEYIMLKNLLGYQEKQFRKLKRIKILLCNTNALEHDFINRKLAKGFIPQQDYNPKLLIRNFSFKSPIFRHSVRLSVTVMIGYVLGSLFPFQNPYWILLTIIVIMRPNYGLTKTRAKDRIIGTLIGGAVAYGMVFIVQDFYALGALAVASLVIAFSLIQINSKASAAFITLSVVFIYAILSTDVMSVIYFRIIDTTVGASLSFFALLWLWPSWESVEMKESIEKSVEANRNFFCEITDYYQKKGAFPTSYYIARNEAFLETSNLNSAFQRMAQEPKSKQNKMEENYELVVLNHNFLASLASLSTFIQHHKTTQASDEFISASQLIKQNLEIAIDCLNHKSCYLPEISKENEALFEKQLQLFNYKEIDKDSAQDKPNIYELQEAHLVWEQLQWLFSLSRKIGGIAASIK